MININARLLTFLLVMAAASGMYPAQNPAAPSESHPISIKSRLELFVDEFLIDRMTPPAELRLHNPDRRDVPIVTDKPWQGNGCTYWTLFKDGARFRMYFGTGQLNPNVKDMETPLRISAIWKVGTPFIGGAWIATWSSSTGQGATTLFWQQIPSNLLASISFRSTISLYSRIQTRISAPAKRTR